MDPARIGHAPAAAISTDEDARAIVATHTEDDDGYCAPCRASGIRVHVPCFALIEAARHLAALRTRPGASPAAPVGGPDLDTLSGGAANGVPPC
ncbi:hypothetical protein [Longispora urticae]